MRYARTAIALVVMVIALLSVSSTALAQTGTYQRPVAHAAKKRHASWVTKWKRLPSYARAWTLNTSRCEARRWWPNKRAMARIATGNGFLGAFQWVLQTWYSAGGRVYPTRASWYEQAVRAWYWHLHHPHGQWPVCGE